MSAQRHRWVLLMLTSEGLMEQKFAVGTILYCGMGDHVAVWRILHCMYAASTPGMLLASTVT